MIIKPLLRAQLLAALSFSAIACGTDPADVSLVDGGTNDGGAVDASIPEVDCDGKNVGSTERRVRYQAASVPTDGECVAQEQARVCEQDGTWTEWTGDYEAESCSVAGFAGCEGQPHGTKQTRDRYELESVAFGEQCTKQSQSRECSDGRWSDWSGSYTFEQCQVKGAASCDQTPHGEEQTRLRYESLTVPYGSLCRPETQTRDCKNGTFSPWSGTLTAESCRVLEALSCGNSPHGTVEKQTRFESSLVESGECQSQEQTRTCGNGAWSGWSGTFTAEICDVEGKRRCGSTLHGEDENRLRYQRAEEPYGVECVSEQQTRVCNNGTFGAWSGSYESETCSNAAPADCDTGKHGDGKTRTRFGALSVPYGTTCSEEIQNSTCNNGVWGPYSGTFTAATCSVAPPASCDDVAHGEKGSRTSFQAATVPFGQTCVSELQDRTCNNGVWGPYSGTFTAATCSVAPPASCDGVAHGEKGSRTYFQAATVPFGQTCVSELQESTCNNGVWGPYSGTFTAPSCSVTPPAPCDGVAHGDKGSRTYYQAATVPFGQTCVSELQERTCNNGVWGSYSGNFTASSCSVAPPASCGNVAHGGKDTRTRFQAETVPFGQTCVSEQQESNCNNGVLGPYSGTFKEETCSVADKIVATCDQHTTLALGVCHEFSGPNATTDANNTCLAGTRGTGCPANTLGRCDLSNVRTNPPGYVQWFYVNAYYTDASVSEKVCKDGGGTWSAP